MEHIVTILHGSWLNFILGNVNTRIVKDNGEFAIGDTIKFDVLIDDELVDPEVVKAESDKRRYRIKSIEKPTVDGELLVGYKKLVLEEIIRTKEELE